MKKVLILSVICYIILLGVPFIVNAQSIPVGGPCANDTQCASGHCLNYTCVCMFDSECTASQPICCTDSCRSAVPVGVGGWCCRDSMCQSGTCDTEAEMCSCNDNADCPSGQRCNLNMGMCESTSLLPYDSDCDSGAQCLSNFCDPIMQTCGCTATADCPSGRMCDTTTRTCGASGTTCTNNTECFPYYCNTILNVCAPCVLDTNCDSGQTCNAGYCEGGDGGGGTYYCYFVDDNRSQMVGDYSGQAACMDECRWGYDNVVDVGPDTAWCCLAQNLGDTSTNVCGGGTTPGEPGTPLPGGSSSIPNPLKCGDVECVVQAIADIITGLVTVIGTIMIIIGGIQYISSAGSEDKARRAKNTILYAIIGIAIAVSVDFIVGFLKEVLGSGGGN